MSFLFSYQILPFDMKKILLTCSIKRKLAFSIDVKGKIKITKEINKKKAWTNYQLKFSYKNVNFQINEKKKWRIKYLFKPSPYLQADVGIDERLSSSISILLFI